MAAPPRHGSFLRLTRLAAGGMGVVYLGIHPEGRQLGAIKTMFRQHLGDTARVDRFRKECLLHARLRHPHVVACLEASAHDAEPSLVLEYLRGHPLSEALEAGPLPPWEAAELLESLASALDYLHARGVQHHDLKPSNVYATRSGRYLLLDMGVAAEENVTLASSRTFLYSAPEVNRAEANDPRADLYSLGLVLFECLTGVRALGASSLAGAIQEQASREVPDPRELVPALPEGLATLTRDLTRARAEARPASAHAVLERLRPVRLELAAAPAAPFARVQRQGRILAFAAHQEFEAALGLLDALEHDLPAHAWCAWQRARLQAARGRFVESLEHLRVARERGLDEAEALEHEGLCLLQAGRNLEAHGRFQALAAVRPDDPMAAGLVQWLETAD